MGSASAPFAALVIGLAVLLGGCDNSDETFTPTGSLRLQVADTSLEFQCPVDAENPICDPADPPGTQIVRWTVEEATADISGFGTFNFVGKPSCPLEQNVLRPASLIVSCNGSGLALAPDGPRDATVTLRISSMELVRASRPDLPPAGDFDGDGFPNDSDTCPLVDNEDQADVNDDGVGDACSIVGGTGDPTVPDQDGDGLVDIVDNCAFVPNPDQEDEPGVLANGIGTACEIVLTVSLPQQEFLRTATAFSVSAGVATILTVDFDSASSVTCTPTCVLDPSKVVLNVTP